MNSNSIDEAAIAQAELNRYLETQAQAIRPAPDALRFAPLHNLLVPVEIKVERVGSTRNASNTPYAVYKVDGRR